MGPLKLTPLGFQQITSTALVTNAPASLTPPAGAQVALIVPVNDPVYWRDDGTAPTVAAGMPIPTGLLPWEYWGDLNSIEFISTSTGAINVSYYKIAG